MDRQHVLERLGREKVIAIVRGVGTEEIEAVAQALLAGGISCMEITVDHRTDEGREDTYRSIARLRDRLGETVCLGAGTVLDETETERAVEAGADYIISPNLDQAVVRRTRELGKVSIPGAFTPSEAVQAARWGADIVKLFPVGLLGPAYIRALRGPLPHIPFCAVGELPLKTRGISSGRAACPWEPEGTWWIWRRSGRNGLRTSRQPRGGLRPEPEMNRQSLSTRACLGIATSGPCAPGRTEIRPAGCAPREWMLRDALR